MCKRILKNQTSPIGDVPFYKIGTFGSNADSFIPQSLFDEFKYKYPYPKVGQVLLSAAGTIGKSIIFDGKDAYFQDSNIVWIDTDDSLIDNTYLHFCFKYFVDWSSYMTSGSVISRLYNDDVRAVNIPHPNLTEQKKLSKAVSQIEAQISELQAKLSQMDSMKQAIVNQYLTA